MKPMSPMYPNSLIWRFFPKNSKYGQQRHTPFMQILEATVNQISLGNVYVFQNSILPKITVKNQLMKSNKESE